jgi:hypothetical protein
MPQWWGQPPHRRHHLLRLLSYSYLKLAQPCPPPLRPEGQGYRYCHQEPEMQDFVLGLVEGRQRGLHVIKLVT